MNLLDLKRRCLKHGGLIVPARFDVFVEPVSLKDEYHIPPIWELEDLGIDVAFLETYPGLKKYIGKFHGLRSLKNFEVVVWHGLYVPKGTPKPVIDRLVAALQAAVKDPGFKAKLADLGAEPVPVEKANPQALQQHLKAEIAIMNLHEKLDHLLHTQWERLLELQQIQIDMLSDLEKHRRS